MPSLFGFLKPAGLGIALSMIVGTSAIASDIVVKYDHSAIMRLTRPVAEVIIGNPSIADISIQSSKLVVVTGRTFGTTNVIALDSAGQIIRNQRIVVKSDEARVVNLHRGPERSTYSCSPGCQSTLTIGDAEKHFKLVEKSTSTKLAISHKQAEPQAGGGGQ